MSSQFTQTAYICLHVNVFWNAFTCVIRKSIVCDAVQLVQQEQLQVSNTDCGDLHIHGVSKQHIEGRKPVLEMPKHRKQHLYLLHIWCTTLYR